MALPSNLFTYLRKITRQQGRKKGKPIYINRQLVEAILKREPLMIIYCYFKRTGKIKVSVQVCAVVDSNR